ncbi:hypothetical protein D3C71_591330 [compost metagenome]
MRIRPPSQIHIHDISILKINFCRAPRPFHKDNLIGRTEASKRLHHRPLGLWQKVVTVSLRTHMCKRLAMHNDLGMHIPGWLNQNGIHIGGGLNSASLGLYALGPADLQTVLGHIGVQRHVLRLERSCAETILLKNTA